MRRHVRWVVLLLSAPITYIALMLVVQWLGGIATDAEQGTAIWLSILALALMLAAVVVPLVLLVRAIIEMRRTFRRAQRAKGRYTKLERQQLATANDAAAWWEYARHIRGQLLRREVPEAQQQWDVVPRDGEVFVAAMPLTYARYYGTDVAYNSSSSFAFGRPAFVVGVLAVTAISNARARSRVAAQAVPQWREWQQTTAYVTNQRIVVFANGQWLSFDYRAVAAVYPDVASNALVCQFDAAEPLLLSGVAAPVAAVFTVMQTHGLDAVRTHPGLQHLDAPAAEPTLPPLGRRG